MRTIVLTLGILLLQATRALGQASFGTVFPVPLTTDNDDPNFKECPKESGAYAHTTNCSLFHMCTFGILATYSCIDGFYFYPSSGKCQYLPFEKDAKCAEILKYMADADAFPLAEPVKGYNYYHRRKSSKSECTETGIYPDELDCSLFHYCRKNHEHQILQCPSGLRFDPKLFMCSALQLVNCQYEPPVETTDAATLQSDSICRDYASGTRLPVANKFDAFLVCESDGTSTLHKCEPSLRYNALKMQCEANTCQTNPGVCQNHGRCVDEPTGANGFRCVCSIEYQGEHCDKAVEIVKIIKDKATASVRSLLQFADRLAESRELPTTAAQVTTPVDTLDPPSASSNDDENTEKSGPSVNTPLSRMFHRRDDNLDDQQRMAEFIQVVFVTVFTLIGLFLLALMIFGTIVCVRTIFNAPVENVGTWKVLAEESKV